MVWTGRRRRLSGPGLDPGSPRRPGDGLSLDRRAGAAGWEAWPGSLSRPRGGVYTRFRQAAEKRQSWAGGGSENQAGKDFPLSSGWRGPEQRAQLLHTLQRLPEHLCVPPAKLACPHSP